MVRLDSNISIRFTTDYYYHNHKYEIKLKRTGIVMAYCILGSGRYDFGYTPLCLHSFCHGNHEHTTTTTNTNRQKKKTRMDRAKIEREVPCREKQNKGAKERYLDKIKGISGLIRTDAKSGRLILMGSRKRQFSYLVCGARTPTHPSSWEIIHHSGAHLQFTNGWVQDRHFSQ